MAGNHTGPRTLRLSSDNSPGVLVFTLSQVVANELLSSESINLIISRDEDFPIVSINGVATSGVYEGTDTQIKLEEFMKTEEGFKTELEDTGVWDDKEDVSKIDHTSDDEEAIHDRLSSLDSDDNDDLNNRNYTVSQNSTVADGSPSRHNTRSVSNSEQPSTRRTSLRKKRTHDGSSTDKLAVKKQKITAKVSNRKVRLPDSTHNFEAALSKEPIPGVDSILRSILKLPDNISLPRVVTVGGVKHEAWNVHYETLTSDETEWLEKQDDLRRNMPNQKPVPWFQLGLRMFRESQKRKDPRFRPLYHETLGTAWNYKKWRFSGQDTEFPVFTKSDNWSVWTKNTDWGKRWVAGEERWPNVPTEIRNFQGAVIKMSPGVQTQI